jgi:hypothetical protein
METDNMLPSMPPLPAMETVPHMLPGMPPLPKTFGPYIPIGGLLGWQILMQAISACVMTVSTVGEFRSSAMSGSLLAFSSILIFSYIALKVVMVYLLWQPSRWTMPVLRWHFLLGITLGLLFIVGSLSDPTGWKLLSYNVVWGLYFMMSDRVWRTYGRNLTVFGIGRKSRKSTPQEEAHG